MDSGLCVSPDRQLKRDAGRLVAVCLKGLGFYASLHSLRNDNRILSCVFYCLIRFHCASVCVFLLPFYLSFYMWLRSITVADKSHLTCAIIVVYSSLVPPARTPALVFPFNHEFQFRSCSSLLHCRPLSRVPFTCLLRRKVYYFSSRVRINSAAELTVVLTQAKTSVMRALSRYVVHRCLANSRRIIKEKRERKETKLKRRVES